MKKSKKTQLTALMFATAMSVGCQNPLQESVEPKPDSISSETAVTVETESTLPSSDTSIEVTTEVITTTSDTTELLTETTEHVTETTEQITEETTLETDPEPVEIPEYDPDLVSGPEVYGPPEWFD